LNKSNAAEIAAAGRNDDFNNLKMQFQTISYGLIFKMVMCNHH
jgi:hypothetical protein